MDKANICSKIYTVCFLANAALPPFDGRGLADCSLDETKATRATRMIYGILSFVKMWLSRMHWPLYSERLHRLFSPNVRAPPNRFTPFLFDKTRMGTFFGIESVPF